LFFVNNLEMQDSKLEDLPNLCSLIISAFMNMIYKWCCIDELELWTRSYCKFVTMLLYAIVHGGNSIVCNEFIIFFRKRGHIIYQYIYFLRFYFIGWGLSLLSHILGFFRDFLLVCTWRIKEKNGIKQIKQPEIRIVNCIL
jgi:hypothetical protein